MLIQKNKNMKKSLILIALMAIVLNAQTQTLTAIAANKGVAPIPSFGIENPAVLVFINTKLGKKGVWEHIEFSPDVAFNSGNRLWFSDVWLRYNHWSKKDTLKKTVYTLGVDFPSLFGQPYMLPTGETLNQVVVYWTVQGRIKRILNKNLSLTLDYWYLRATEMKYGVAGSYISTSASWEKGINKKLSFTANPNIFYLGYTDRTKGFVSSLGVTLTHKKSGLFLGALGLAPITSKQVKSNWNISLGISRKLF
jgi:hypothetical protein